MELSVVVPTLNDRERLVDCLDALAAHVPAAEVIVVNGPSTDGTTGMVRERDDVNVLVEIADRNLNVGRNAGIAAATGDVVALVGQGSVVEEGWADAVRTAFEDGATVVTGPVHRAVRAGVTTETPESRRIAGRDVAYFDGGNVAFVRETVEAIDGFDEYLLTGGARDAAHRLAGLDHAVDWLAEAAVLRERPTDERVDEHDWGWKHRALGYRLAKNYGLRPTIVRRIASHAVGDGLGTARSVVAGDIVLSRWLGCGRDVIAGIAVGTRDGLLARVRDRSPSRNPNGLSARADRAVERYDRR